jgi:hypothetical protein
MQINFVAELLKYLGVYVLSMFKFIVGPTIGISSGLNIFVTFGLSVAGMMTMVYLVTYFGEQVRFLTSRFFKPKPNEKKFTKKKRLFVTLWKKYGVYGVSFFSPLFITPIGGALILNTLGVKKEQIIGPMWLSAIFWGIILTLFVKYAKDLILWLY